MYWCLHFTYIYRYIFRYRYIYTYVHICVHYIWKTHIHKHMYRCVCVGVEVDLFMKTTNTKWANEKQNSWYSLTVESIVLFSWTYCVICTANVQTGWFQSLVKSCVYVLCRNSFAYCSRSLYLVRVEIVPRWYRVCYLGPPGPSSWPAGQHACRKCQWRVKENHGKLWM